jgi:Arc/MetJ family transcription regulator
MSRSDSLAPENCHDVVTWNTLELGETAGEDSRRSPRFVTRSGLRINPAANDVYILFVAEEYTAVGEMLVPKRLIDLDDELLAAARRELNTTGIADTVRTALQQAVAKSARARQIEWLEGGGLAGLADRNERDDVWR